jgi:glycylpeptide N-tetradecanoyltransferase
MLTAKAMLNRNAPKTEDELQSKEKWKFWETQPVPALKSSIPVGINEPIEPNKKLDEIKADSFSLPDGFNWDDLDLNNKDELSELYNLLTENYVEDDDNMFRFDYSREFLKWYNYSRIDYNFPEE